MGRGKFFNKSLYKKWSNIVLKYAINLCKDHKIICQNIIGEKSPSCHHICDFYFSLNAFMCFLKFWQLASFIYINLGFPCGSVDKESACNAKYYGNI